MKKSLKTILFSVILGISLSVVTLYYLTKETTLNEEVNALQIGVYQNKENAQKVVESYPGSIMIEEDGFYRVYIAIALGNGWTDTLEKHYEEENIEVYPKSIKVSKQLYEELDQYTNVIGKVDWNVLAKINQELMKKLKGEVL